MRDQLHFYVSAAQRALLNPDAPADIFVRDADRAANESISKSSASDGSFDDLGAAASQAAAGAEDELKFTHNVVVLETTGADVDVALVDLPGMYRAGLLRLGGERSPNTRFWGGVKPSLAWNHTLQTPCSTRPHTHLGDLFLCHLIMSLDDAFAHTNSPAARVQHHSHVVPPCGWDERTLVGYPVVALEPHTAELRVTLN